MSLNRYSSPPRTSSSRRSDVGWKLRERHLRENRGVPLALYNSKNNSDSNNNNNNNNSNSRNNRTTNTTHINTNNIRDSISESRGESGSKLRSINDNDNDNDNDMPRLARFHNRSGVLPTSRRHPWSSSSLSSSSSSSSLDNNKGSCHTSSTRSSYTRRFRPPSTDVDAIDPSLPPAFRVALRIEQQRRRKHNNSNNNKDADDASSCLGSVASHCSTTANSTACDWSLDDDHDFLDDDDDDDADSFASIQSDADEDDDAILESRNQLARAEHEMRSSSSSTARRRPTGSFSRFSSNLRIGNTNRGVHGTPLGLIVEER